jgi:predicted DNA-binding protein
MGQIAARLPDGVVEALDAAAKALHQSRAEIVRQAVERYPEDFDDLTSALERLRNPTDPVLTGMRSGVNYSVRIKRSAVKELARVSAP